MWLNIIELCRKDDKRKDYYISVNQNIGWTVYEYRNHYISLFTTESVWKSPTAEFKPVRSGTYVFKGNELVKV